MQDPLKCEDIGSHALCENLDAVVTVIDATTERTLNGRKQKVKRIKKAQKYTKRSAISQKKMRRQPSQVKMMMDRNCREVSMFNSVSSGERRRRPGLGAVD